MKQLLQSIWKQACKKRGVSFYFAAASFAFAAAMLVVYARTGITTFTPALSEKVIALLCVCLFLSLLFSVFEIKAGKYVLYLFCLWMWLEYLASEASYISNVLVSIDGNSFGFDFILTAACGLLAWATALTSAILQKREIGSSKITAEAERGI